MNYFEHRLFEIRQEIEVLRTRDDTIDKIRELQEERKQILQKLVEE